MRSAVRRRPAVLIPLCLAAARCSSPDPTAPPATRPATRPAAVAAATVRLTVRVTDLRNHAGDLLVGVFAAPAGFPSDQSKSVGWAVLPADGPATATFDLPPGTYAVGVLHDENRNGQMDTNFLGIPKEGYGVSNNPKPHRRAARYDEATVPAAADTAVTISLQYDFL